jgi:magnesium transporter
MIVTHPASGALGEVTWVDLLDPTREEVERVRDATGLRVPTNEEVSEIQSSSRLAMEQAAYYVTTPLLAGSDEDHLKLAPAGFVLSARVLITVHFTRIDSLDDARVACVKGCVTTAEESFLRILEAVVDRAADSLERAGNECDALSHAVFHGHGAKGHAARTSLRKIGHIAHQASYTRDELLGIARIVGFIGQSALPDVPLVNAARMKAIGTDIASLTEYETRLSAKVQFALDATLGFINIEQNEIVKTLTVASVVGIPPVLVAGIYGMNFHEMPELGWPLGYPMALALIVVSALLPLFWFRKRGWL